MTLGLAAFYAAAAGTADNEIRAPAASEGRGRLPAATWRQPGLAISVELADDAAVGARPAGALQHYAIGVAALPVALLQPQVAFGLPFYLLLAAPWQAAFNARADALARVLVTEPLPDAVVQALRAQWRSAPTPGPAVQAALRLSAYGLATRSGRRLEAFDAAEDLCLVAAGRLEVSVEGRPLVKEDVAIDPWSSTRDLPPPLCAPLARWAADEGRLLRQATRETAELLAALIVDRMEHQP